MPDRSKHSEAIGGKKRQRSVSEGSGGPMSPEEVFEGVTDTGGEGSEEATMMEDVEGDGFGP